MPPQAMKAKTHTMLLKRAREIASLGKMKSVKRGTGDLEPDGVLRCTEKLSNCALLLQQRCMACHGETVRDVVGKVMENGSQYKMPDLRYDIKGGRLVVMAPGSKAGPMPKLKPRKDAPCAGQPMPAATLDEFFKFLQCQLRMELREHTQGKLELPDKAADGMWPDVEAFITPNLGASERWVPYHTVLGVHELFLVEAVHPRKDWTEEQRFTAMFIFRAHCKRDLFNKAELPIMLQKGFWKDPRAAFAPGGPMEKSILAYRKKTGQPLLTSCFRIIPPRVLKDDTANLVRSITDRTMNLIDVAERAWPVFKDSKRGPVERIEAISHMVQDAPGCGDTWAKMLTVCIDLAYPKEQFLEKQCDVGTGAEPPLRCLLPKCTGDKTKDLQSLLTGVNSSKSPHAQHFWTALQKSEGILRSKFKSLPLVLAQAATKKNRMTAVTLQVQLCEYRQFRNSVARAKYGLPDDEAMRCSEPERKSAVKEAEDFVELNEAKKCVEFDLPLGEKKVHFEVPIKAVGNRRMVAARVAAMCFYKIREGMSKQEAEKFREEVVAGYREGEDVADNSPAWAECRTQLSHSCPLVAFQIEGKDGKTFPFQCTQQAAGTALECERIARLCYTKLKKGASKDDVLKYRNDLYKKRAAEDSNGGEPSAKRARK